jgi:hypothetical protein
MKLEGEVKKSGAEVVEEDKGALIDRFRCQFLRRTY